MHNFKFWISAFLLLAATLGIARPAGKLAEAGFDNIVFMGGPVVGDFYVTASYWYGLNIDDIEFVVHPDFDFKLTDWFGLEQAGHPESLARVISFAGNLTNTQRRAAFKYTDLDYTL